MCDDPVIFLITRAYIKSLTLFDSRVWFVFFFGGSESAPVIVLFPKDTKEP